MKLTATHGVMISADMSEVTTPPSSRKYLDAFNDDESTASTVLSDESQSVISIQNAALAQKEQQPSPFDRFRSRIASSFISSSSPTSGQGTRSAEEQAEYLHKTRLKILLKNPELFCEFQKRTRESGTITPTGVRLALYHFLQDMRVVELLEDLKCENRDDEMESERRSSARSARRSFFSPFGIYTYSRAPSIAMPRLGHRASSGGRRGHHDDASVLTFDESLAMPSLAGCDDEDEDDDDDDDNDEGFGSDGEHHDNDCSSVGSRSLATTFSGLSSMSSQPRSFNRKPDSWRSMDSRSSSLRLVIHEDEDFP
jgi:hypothetical protein